MSERAHACVLSLLALALVGGCEPRLTLGAGCARSTDCEAPLTCAFDRRCREACVSSRDCDLGLVCVRDPNAPDPATAPRVCSFASDGCSTASCAEGLVCVDQRCVNRCRLADECPDGVCRAGACEPMALAGPDASPDGGDAGAALDAADARAPDARGDDAGSLDAPALETGVDAPGADGGSVPDAGVGPDAAVPDLGEALLGLSGATSDLARSTSVALSADGSIALVGVPSADAFDRMTMTLLPAAGVVYVFARTGSAWSLEATLVAPDRAATDAFGTSVALAADGRTALVGAPLSDRPGRIDRGSAYVFVRVDSAGGPMWFDEATLLPALAEPDGHFGTSVALSADGAHGLVGAPGAALGAGNADVFLRSGAAWTLEATLVGSAGGIDAFGSSSALDASGVRAVVGAPQASGDAGRAYVFFRAGTSWTEEAALLSAAPILDLEFGRSVAIDGTGSTLLVGTPGAAVSGALIAGGVEVFARTGTTWAAAPSIAASVPTARAELGRAVALSADGTRAVVGAPSSDVGGTASVGIARFFERGGAAWSDGGALPQPSGIAGDLFGSCVAVSADGTRALVGGVVSSSTGEVASARVFVLP